MARRFYGHAAVLGSAFAAHDHGQNSTRAGMKFPSQRHTGTYGWPEARDKNPIDSDL